MAAGTTPLTATEFLTPSVFTSDVSLITFDDLGLPASSQFTSRFRTYPGQRSQLYVFPGIFPAGRPGILEHDQFQRAEVDLQITFPTLVWRVAAEIRSGPSPNGNQDLSFEFYRAGTQLAQVTVPTAE